MLEYVDYSFDKHFGRSIPSYAPRAVIYDYLSGRAKAADIRRFIRFRTAVRHVDFDDETQQFQLTVQDLLVKKSLEHLMFDHVVVATGHFSVPNVPEFEGMAQFPGRVLHSHDFRGADEFVNKHLLVIGGSYSADDIALQCSKFGARAITISYRTCPINFKWPANVKEVPMLQRIEGRTAHFKDGSSVDDIDCIVMCTGYRHHYPFMAEQFRLDWPSNSYALPNLYKGVFWVTQPRLAYIGMQNQFYTFTLSDTQAALVRDVFLGYVKLPASDDESARQADIDTWRKREDAILAGDFEGQAYFQTEYMRDILSCCDPTTAPIFDFERANINWHKYITDRQEDIQTYRDQPFASIFSPYNQAPVNPTPWMKAMDDSIKGFVTCVSEIQ